MKKPEATKDQELLEKLIQGGSTNLSEWFENITDEFYKEQAIEERTSVKTIQKIFYTDLTDYFMGSLPTLLFKFLIEKGVGHIVEPHLSLHEPPPNSNWTEKQKSGKNSLLKGSGIISYESKQNYPSFLKHQVGYGGVAGHMSG